MLAMLLGSLDVLLDVGIPVALYRGSVHFYDSPASLLSTALFFLYIYFLQLDSPRARILYDSINKCFSNLYYVTNPLQFAFLDLHFQCKLQVLFIFS